MEDVEFIQVDNVNVFDNKAMENYARVILEACEETGEKVFRCSGTQYKGCNYPLVNSTIEMRILEKENATGLTVRDNMYKCWACRREFTDVDVENRDLLKDLIPCIKKLKDEINAVKSRLSRVNNELSEKIKKNGGS
ncbi:hypothetical protein LCGC14_0804790 [marine sediment metagenome]|uniref:Uncharacterized protein n=1 Tax=marine sediment metagenome TaxID=412755 RepID=A0A0F9S8N2_9ZZZZ